jgi:hypothetical protein
MVPFSPNLLKRNSHPCVLVFSGTDELRNLLGNKACIDKSRKSEILANFLQPGPYKGLKLGTVMLKSIVTGMRSRGPERELQTITEMS